MGARVAGMDDLPACSHFQESKTSMASHDLQVVAAHTLKQRELEQSVVYLQEGHYSSIL